MTEAIRIENVCFTWPGASKQLLAIPQFIVPKSKKFFLKGPSGSGKSTLLNLIAGLLDPDEGDIYVLQTHLNALRRSEKDQFRVDHMGFVFQTFNLIPYLSMIDNVTLPCSFSGARMKKASTVGSLEFNAQRLMNQLGLQLQDCEDRPVTQLSVGQQQRVAVARALIGYPDIVIADEPTSALDSDNRETFIGKLFEQCKATSTTLLYVSHDISISSLFDEVVDIRDINNEKKLESGHAIASIVD